MLLSRAGGLGFGGETGEALACRHTDSGRAFPALGKRHFLGPARRTGDPPQPRPQPRQPASALQVCWRGSPTGAANVTLVCSQQISVFFSGATPSAIAQPAPAHEGHILSGKVAANIAPERPLERIFRATCDNNQHDCPSTATRSSVIRRHDDDQ